MSAERVIHGSIFALIFVGLAVLTGWTSYAYFKSNLVLAVGSILIVWGIILLVLYLSFKRFDWVWWS